MFLALNGRIIIFAYLLIGNIFGSVAAFHGINKKAIGLTSKQEI
jgi:hypothetical protein